jgi:hypothetical protein
MSDEKQTGLKKSKRAQFIQQSVYTEYRDPRREEWQTKVLPALRKLRVPVLIRLTNKSRSCCEEHWRAADDHALGIRCCSCQCCAKSACFKAGMPAAHDCNGLISPLHGRWLRPAYCASTSVTFEPARHTASILFDPWAVGDAAEWEQNQAGRSSARRSGLRESFARPETAHFTFCVRTQTTVISLAQKSSAALRYPAEFSWAPPFGSPQHVLRYLVGYTQNMSRKTQQLPIESP